MNAPAKIDRGTAQAVSPLARLREPFPENQVSKLPKESRAQIDERKAGKNTISNCPTCGGWHHKNAVHLDYVGHAALTDRLLDVDPLWSWEPAGFTPEGLPAFDRNGGLWIKLTVCDVTRFGYGSADGKAGGDAVKEIIGDALRNAAMRFGAALDLWHKGDLHAPEQEGDTSERSTPKQQQDRSDGRSAIFVACQAAIDICGDEGSLTRWKAENAEAFSKMDEADLTAVKRYWQLKVKQMREAAATQTKPKEEFPFDDEIPF